VKDLTQTVKKVVVLRRSDSTRNFNGQNEETKIMKSEI